MTLRTEEFVLNFGPAHPSTHGVFRIKATLDGEVITKLEPVYGYLHRGIEKLCEERTYVGIIPLTDRLDYLGSMSNNMGYVMAVEKLGNFEVPERAEYIRVIPVLAVVDQLPRTVRRARRRRLGRVERYVVHLKIRPGIRLRVRLELDIRQIRQHQRLGHRRPPSSRLRECRERYRHVRRIRCRCVRVFKIIAPCVRYRRRAL